jgi:hypothetical protein
MGLQSSGSISLSDIAGEFGGSTPHSLSEYYDAASGIPANGQISLSDFYGTSAMTPVVFANLTSYDIAVTYVSNLNKVVFALKDVFGGAGNRGNAIAGDMSDGKFISTSTGGLANFMPYGPSNDISITSDGNKAIITYEALQTYYAVVATVSSNNGISYGSQSTISDYPVNYPTSTYDSLHNKVVVVWSDPDSWDIKARVGTVSGTNISFGPIVNTFIKGSYKSSTYISGNGQVLIAYHTYGINPSEGRSIVGTVSGNSISFGSPTTFNSGYSGFVQATYDSTNQRVVIAYRNTSPDRGEVVVGSVSGGAGHYGSPVQFTSNDYPLSDIGMVYNSANNSVDILHTRGNNGLVVRGTVNSSGNSISFEPEFAITTGEARFPSATFDSSSGKTVFAYSDGDNSSFGTVLVI